ncbi:MAG: PilZ domain-containing protein [Desulfuromonadaceae bacterium]|nr:PilZ domain-containing protein [Desulfuromonadaceae bacterium]MDD2855247.1 PilZ domain-containing protein [Desulfuromonadaceae bacterium]
MDFTSLYSTRIQTNFDDDQALILRRIDEKCTSKDGLKVTLTNYYRGLPIIYPATIIAVERGNLDLDVNPQQAVAISDDRYTLIRCNLFPFPVLAHAQYVNIKKHAVSLNKLCFVEVLAERRAAVRLNLDPPVKATILYDDQTIAGELIDLSTQGIGVTVDSYITINPEAEISVRFMLPDPVLQKQTLLKVSASLIDISGDAQPYLYKFKIAPEKHQEQLLSRYSFQRQVEIIKGLKEVVD